MASTPLYKRLKSNGTTFYAFPGAAEDISASYQNNNYRMYFSKYVLLNLPKQNLNEGTQSKPVVFDFDNSFAKSVNATPAVNFQESVVESLRNYVANQEVVIRESRFNNTNYFYDTNILETSSEKIFWKWCKKLNIVDFEPAIPDDEYFQNLPEFASRSINEDDYFPEILWKEREVTPYDTVNFYESGQIGFTGKLEIEFTGVTNFRIGDTINIYNVANTTILNNLSGDPFIEAGTEEGKNTKVLQIIPSGATQGQRIIVDINSVLGANSEFEGEAKLVYHRLVQYIGEVNGVSNVAEANRSYTEVYAHIPAHTGRTPDILFRTKYDKNYRPNLSYPIIASQYQPEILGAESFNSPIVSSPQDYPGSYFGQFDTLDFTYETSTGDELRRSGDYFGVIGDVNTPITYSSDLDGITLDFAQAHYVKMNLLNRTVTNFDEFNAMIINNEPPIDFDFNAILWYYNVEDSTGSATTNLYGITFLDNPDNNPVPEDVGLKFPLYKKMVENGEQDGTSYSFSLILNFNLINDNVNNTFNPQAINALFNMNLFNQAMSRLASTTDSFNNIIIQYGNLTDEIQNIKSLIMTQTDLNTINTRINNLESLLRLYSTLQLQSSSSIQVRPVGGATPFLQLFNTDLLYSRIDTLLTSQMYNTLGVIPINISVPTNRTILLSIMNNDEVSFQLPNQEKLRIIFDRELDLFQMVEVVISANEFASQNKKLDILIRDFDSNGQEVNSLLLGDINLPVFYNNVTQLPNSAYLWKDFNFDIDLTMPITIDSNLQLEVPFSGNTSVLQNSIKNGDVLYLNNLYVGTSSVYDFSGQYVVSSTFGPTSSYFRFDINSNSSFLAYGASASLPLQLHGTQSTLLSNNPYFSLNKGMKIRIYKVANGVSFNQKYKIEVDDIN